MADLDHIHTAISTLYPAATFGGYAWVQPYDEKGEKAGDPFMGGWDEERFGELDMHAVLAECARIEAMPPAPPDRPTLRDWRVALRLWGRLEEVMDSVSGFVKSGNPLGGVALESFEFSNHVLRKELLALKDALGFSEAEVDESLWRADRVRQGDLSGKWPVESETSEGSHHDDQGDRGAEDPARAGV